MEQCKRIILSFPNFCHVFEGYSREFLSDLSKSLSLQFGEEDCIIKKDGGIVETAVNYYIGDTSRPGITHVYSTELPDKIVQITIIGDESYWNHYIDPPKDITTLNELSLGIISKDLYRLIDCIYGDGEKHPIVITKNLTNDVHVNIPVIVKEKIP